MKNILFVALLCFSNTSSFGQPESEYVKKYFLIAASTSDYSTALENAKSISKNLKLKLDLRGLNEYKDNEGLTWDKSICEEGNRNYPCYLERGNTDDGNYVSVEWSSAYEGFAKGLYIVVVSSQTELKYNVYQPINDFIKQKGFFISSFEMEKMAEI
jgi:hypothetical protein